jgi:hypothetical protein
VNVIPLTACPPPDLAAALARFEAGFTYPLGPGRTFRISHGDDYPRFYRAMGDAVCFVAERGGEVLGVLAAAVRPLARPDGSVRPALYIGDLKIAPAARGGRVLVRLAEAMAAWAAGKADAGFAVVMGGTPVTPDRYTGRLGLPAFRELARVAVLRLPTDDAATPAEEVSAADGEAVFRRLAAGRYAAAGGNPTERSETAPTWLALPDGAACGRLEDTRRAKRLISDDGGEMVSAHLSCFGYADAAAGPRLLDAARARAAAIGVPALFVAVPEADAAPFAAVAGAVVAPAVVYGTGLEAGVPWAVNTAEV